MSSRSNRAVGRCTGRCTGIGEHARNPRTPRRLGLLRAPRRSLAGRLVRRLDAFPGPHLRLGALRRRGVEVVGRVRGARGREVLLDGARSLALDGVVWAMGYRERSGWVDVPEAKDEQGRLLEHRGVSPVPGLYFVGRDWQWSRGSALVCGVGRDAAWVAARLAEWLGASPRGSRAPASVARS